MQIKFKRFYFVGIGGIGMSGLGHYLYEKKMYVAGCDYSLNQKSVIQLIEKGIAICQENESPKHIKECNPDIMITTNTVSENHPALIYAKKNNIQCIARAELLALITNPLKTIGITGSHGKTSTTAMTSHIFINSDYDPTIFVGGFMKSINSNFRVGSSEYAIIEADDAYKSFLYLTMHISLITTIGFEHLETYKNWDDIYKTFAQYANQTKPEGHIIINNDCKHIKNAMKYVNRKYITYGLDKESDFSCEIIHSDYKGTQYKIFENKIEQGEIFLPIPGIHMACNSVGAYAAAKVSGITHEKIAAALSTHKGVERRFQYKGTFYNCPVIDDYGHHPNEIEQVLKTAKIGCKGKLIIFFQAHKYSRTYHLWDEFIRVFSENPPDELIVTDIFTSFEDIIPGCTAQKLTEDFKKNKINATYVPLENDFKSLLIQAQKYSTYLNSDDMIIALGAGKLDEFAEKLCSIK